MSSQKNKKFKELKKSHICLFGFFLIIFGSVLLSYNHISRLKKEVFSQMQLSFIEDANIEESLEYVPKVEEIKEENNKENEVKEEPAPIKEKKVDYAGNYNDKKVRHKHGKLVEAPILFRYFNTHKGKR